ncbi:MAG TPA: rhodanese-like domain-containing protein, partial [Candidatus Sulfopaludibacter sp.]|nr:rhodanese-like domain-containing protein [Candidatus Sulfopaludibacter sp.]
TRNRSGAAPLAELKAPPELSPAEVESLAARPDAVLLDTRPVMQFAGAHVPGSVHVGLSGQFASWAARLLGVTAHIVLVAEDEIAVRESRTRLARVGIENVEGYLAGGLPNWIGAGKAIVFVPQVSVQELAEWRRDRPAEMTLLDVREAGERSAGCLASSLHVPLGQLPSRMSELNREGMWLVHCRSGYRSSTATSLMLRAGFPNVANVTGGYDAWKTAFPDVQ